MKSIAFAVIVVALVTAACGGETVSSSPSAGQSSIPSQPAADPTATSSAAGVDELTGQWTTGLTSCAEQNAALEAAGVTAEQMTIGGWSPTCAEGYTTQFTIAFRAGGLWIFEDGFEGWTGVYRILDDRTFEAGDAENGYYITYEFAIDGDELAIDMTKIACPFCASPAELAGELIAQSVIYETSPFTRQD